MRTSNLILIGFVTLISACAHSPWTLRSATPEELKEESNSELCGAYLFYMNPVKSVQEELSRRNIVPVSDQPIMDNANLSLVPRGATESTLLCKIIGKYRDKSAAEQLDSNPLINKPGKRQYKRTMCDRVYCTDQSYLVVDGKVASSTSELRQNK